MKRYLLFDSGCSTCSTIAHAIEQEMDGPFTVRSLRDPEIQELLNQTNPGWRWEPTWFEVHDGTARAYTGLAMGLRLVRTLGPRQALRLMQLVNRHSVSSLTSVDPADPGRRHFLRRSGSAFAALALLLGWPKSLLFRETITETTPQQVPSNQALPGPTEGEIWEGFLLLPPGAPVPDFVTHPELSIPIVCGVGVGRGGPAPTAISETFDSAEALAAVVDFPVYTLDPLPEELQASRANLIRHETREVFAASMAFQSFNEAVSNWETTVSIWAHPDFPRPFPLWSSDPVEPGGPAVELEKVNFLPSPGVMVGTRRGYVFHWIENNVYYSLIAEHSRSRGEAQALVELLRSI